MRADLPKRKPPTHTLVVEFPLYLTGVDESRFTPVDDALRVIMSLSRVAVEGFSCGDATATLREEHNMDAGERTAIEEET